MRSCIIFCAAGFDGLLSPIPEDALTIAADGGLLHIQSLGLCPDVILGDFDSLGYVPEGSQVFPVEKDDTDAMLAVRLGLDRGCTEFFLYGGMDGPRLDHTMANFQTLAFLAVHGARGWLIGRDYIATVATRETLIFPETFSGIFSCFCLGSDLTGLTIRGMKYNLTDGTLSAAFPLGVSNHFIGQEASLTLENGLLLALWDRNNGLCRRAGREEPLC